MNKIILLLGFYGLTLAFAKAQNSSIASPDQMNVLYIGVDNPVTISLGTIPQNELDITLTQGKIEKAEGRKNGYIVKVNTTGDMTINVSHKGKIMGKHLFRVKRMPNPVARLPIYERSNQITAATLRTVTGLITVLENYDFDAKCTITSFICVFKGADNKTTIVKNEGTSFNAQLLELIKKGKVGDLFLFQEIKAKCPEDSTPRLINDIIIGLK
jgi:hypothetical protein